MSDCDCSDLCTGEGGDCACDCCDCSQCCDFDWLGDACARIYELFTWIFCEVCCGDETGGCGRRGREDERNEENSDPSHLEGQNQTDFSSTMHTRE